MATTPKITWGTSFANTWTFPSPIDNPVPRSPAMMSVVESKSGLRDAWVDREDEELTFDVPLIPKANDGSVTGYSTATTGVYHALKWMRVQNLFRFFPDASSGTYHTCYLIDFDFDRDVKRSPGGARYTVTMRIRDSAGSAFSEY